MFEKERERYVKACNEVSSFLGYDDGYLAEILEFDHKAVLLPKFRLVPNFKMEGGNAIGKYDKMISLLPGWRRVLLFPVIFFKDVLRHEARHAVHYNLVDKVYEEDPKLSHRLLSNEKATLYKVMGNLSVRQRATFELAGDILDEKEVPRGIYRDIEKATHFHSITYGLRESFADDSNLYRNAFYVFAIGSTMLFAKGIVDSITGDGKSFDMLYGSLAMFAATMLAPHSYYIGESALTTKNLSKFTPSERRYILTFPRDYVSLEERCAELKKFGFPL